MIFEFSKLNRCSSDEQLNRLDAPGIVQMIAPNSLQSHNFETRSRGHRGKLSTILKSCKFSSIAIDELEMPSDFCPFKDPPDFTSWSMSPGPIDSRDFPGRGFGRYVTIEPMSGFYFDRPRGLWRHSSRVNLYRADGQIEARKAPRDWLFPSAKRGALTGIIWLRRLPLHPYRIAYSKKYSSAKDLQQLTLKDLRTLRVWINPTRNKLKMEFFMNDRWRRDCYEDNEGKLTRVFLTGFKLSLVKKYLDF